MVPTVVETTVVLPENILLFWVKLQYLNPLPHSIHLTTLFETTPPPLQSFSTFSFPPP